MIEIATKIAWALYGTPYIYGGKLPLFGLDCSGFTQLIHHEVGLMPDPRTNALSSGMQWEKYVDKRIMEPVAGCMVFYGKPDNISHVMFCLNETHCIGAADGGNGCYTRGMAQRIDARVKVKPISYRKDIVGYINLFS